MPNNKRCLEIFVSEAQLELLKEHAFPCSERVLETACASELGIKLTGDAIEFDMLAGWVAGEANHARKRRRLRQAELLDDIADQLECVLLP